MMATLFVFQNDDGDIIGVCYHPRERQHRLAGVKELARRSSRIETGPRND